MKIRIRLLSAAAAVACLLPIPMAQALIKIDFPVTRMFAESKTVRSAVIVSVDAGGGVVEIKPSVTFKGGAAPAQVRLQIVGPADLIKRVAIDQPVVIFARETEGKGAAIVHLADTWLLAQCVPDASPPLLRVVQGYDAARAFPGRTASLVRFLAALKAGPSPLADKLDPACLAGSPREVANLAVKATFLEAADLNGDARLDLLIGTAEGVRLFLAAGTGYTNVTSAWGLQGFRAEHAALGDVNGDGLPDMLLGTALLLRQKDHLVRAEAALDLPPEAEWLAATVADVTGDKRADVVVLQKTGELVVLQNPGLAGKSWSRTSRKLWEGGTAAAARFSPDWGETAQLQVMVVRGNGITRYTAATAGEPGVSLPQLTGTTWPPALMVDAQPAGAVKSVALDCDGNGKLDLVLLVPGGGLTLLNRGFGSYWVDNTIHVKLRPADPKALPFVVGPGTLLAGGQLQPGDPPRQNLLVLTEDGRLYDLPNTVPQAP
ncbi:MAG: VCBS repeat-containing protein [bacterium]